MTADAIRDALETLTAANRLDASAVQNLPTVSAGAPVTVTHNGGGANPVTGDILTAAFSAGYTGTVQWQRNGTNIGGATNPTYMAVLADEGATVRPVVTSLIFTATGLTVASGATAPAAFTAGQWTAAATATAGEISFNLTALPANGGSAITALQYRVGAGAPIAFTGTGTGVRVVTAGLTAGVSAALQIRAINTAFPNPDNWSDIKNRTPLAGGGGGTATWQTVSVSAEANPISPAAPAGLVAGDLQVLVIYGSPTADAYTAPAGWTLAGSVHTGFAAGMGIDVWTASGATDRGTWAFSSERTIEVHRVSGASGVRAIEMREANTFVREAGGFWLEQPNMPSPAATAQAGDAVIALFYGPQNTHVFGTPATDYTRATSRVAPNTQGAMYRSNAPAGTTGVLTHGLGATGQWEERASATIVLAAA
jgi:hypothetical protein